MGWGLHGKAWLKPPLRPQSPLDPFELGRWPRAAGRLRPRVQGNFRDKAFSPEEGDFAPPLQVHFRTSFSG